MMRIYLDDVRTPTEPDWVIVRSYEEFTAKVDELGLENIDIISLDHDLGEGAMCEYHNNVSPNYKLDYANIKEKTGYDAAFYLINKFYDQHPERIHMSDYVKAHRQMPKFPQVYTHSANPIGSANIMGVVNNFLMNEFQPQTCIRIRVPNTIKTDTDE